MTSPYEWNPMPHMVAITCPDCGSEARFEFATMAEIAKKDQQAFAKAKAFEVIKMKTHAGGFCHVAVFYPNLYGNITNMLWDLPSAYGPEDWKPYHNGVHPDRFHKGSVVCTQCGCRRAHDLNWPREAYFQIEHKGQVLWAFDRERASELLRFIVADNRDFNHFRFRHFLMRIPSVFLSRKVRDAVAKKLERRLGVKA